MNEMQRDVAIGTQSLAEALVAVGLVATQTEIAMGSLNLHLPLGSHTPHSKQQRHAIGTSRKGDDIFATRHKQTMGRGERPHPIHEIIQYVIVHYTYIE